MKLFVLLILTVFASENGVENDSKCEERFWQNSEKNPILVKIEEDEYVKVNKKSQFIGVSYNERDSKWCVQRWSKKEKKNIHNGNYKDEETAAHASDNLARKLIGNGELKLKLNFPYDHTEVYPEEKTTSSKYIGVSYNKIKSKWRVQRRNKKEILTNGCYDDEETAAHASDTLARKLIRNGELNLRLNFPDDYTEIYPEEKTSKYIGVSYNKRVLKWSAQRWSKEERTMLFNGYYDNEESAAHASDTLARKLMENGEQKLKLNFPDDHTEIYLGENQKHKRKRTKKLLNLKHPQNN